MKKRMMLKMAAGAAILAVVITSCSKNNDNTPFVQQYLPQTVIDNANGRVQDSFVFKNNIIQSVYTDQAADGSYGYRYSFVYGTDGKCKKVEYVNIKNNQVEYIDSVAYGTDKITMISKSADNPNSNTSVYAIKNNQAAFEGSKDSVTNGNTKYVEYTEYTFSGGNLTARNSVYGYRNLDGSNKNSYTSSYNYFYDNKPNGFQYAFEKNPFLYFYMVTYDGFLDVPLGVGNYTKYTYNDFANGNTSSNTFQATNTYNTETGFLLTQKVSDGDGDQWNLKFNFRKAD